MARIALSSVLLISFLSFGSVFSLSSQAPRKTVVTGAAGRTGKIVFSSLNADDRFHAVGLVRTEKSAKKLIKETQCDLDQVCVCDVTNIDEFGDNGLEKALLGADSMVICTSAVPKISKSSVLKQFLKIPINVLSGKKAFDFRSLKFTYAPGQYPEKVDYEGQIAQIDLAKKLGMSQVVIVSSMGGTDPSNFLNTIGKNKDGSGNGDILLWKRKAEKYLVDSGLNYSIIHPGGLKDTEGGLSHFVLDINDELLNREKRSISRQDVASLCIASLTVGKNEKVSLDCITSENDDDEKSVLSAEDALAAFLKEGKTTDYSL